MAGALPDKTASRSLPRPNGIVSVKIDPETGLRTTPSDPDGIFEIFRAERVPGSSGFKRREEESDITQQVF